MMVLCGYVANDVSTNLAVSNSIHILTGAEVNTEKQETHQEMR